MLPQNVNNASTEWINPKATKWLTPPEDLPLPTDEVHLWRIWLNREFARIPDFERFLSPDEVERASQFYFQRDRYYFVTARGLLRVILARYLQTEPARLRFHYSSYGKPALMTTPGQPDLQFNLSHSHGLALFAFSVGRPVGVDVEQMRPDLDYESIARQFFSPQEYKTLMSLAPETRLRAFFTVWTRKEAYLKALGVGLSQPPNRITVSILPGEPPRLLEVAGTPQEIDHWTLVAPAVSIDYLAAVAAAGRNWRLRCWQWPD